ncbi:MAG: hypothetical protein GAK31_01661 [Stenotrophomonas maltophilia]|uniref:Uncharacterized protein n=1 Tax=Stenotrophomonas maltophilia TaxID=40324 RepID=A0A7V8FI42_STEMA|nr:MAG: hypothetical protein GAK31_01661 [Stenotrophomonas maltophilia]
MYQLTSRPDIVKRSDTQEFIPEGHRLWDEYRAWLDAGNTPAPAPLPYALHSPQHYQAIRAAAWEWMTAWVQARNYDTVESCCSYFNSGVPRYRDEARAMVAWRDAVNLALEQLVLAPPVGIETWDQVRALLPQPETFNWPGAAELPLGNDEKAVLE